MQIVVDIPEKDYKDICESAKLLGDRNINYWERKVAKGTPLPERHGRLIDADKLEYTCNSDECGMLTGCNHCQYHIITEDELDDAPTVIEADKGE